MAATYTLISSNVLTSSAASVTFSSIPSTYTDLVLRVSARSNRVHTIDILYVQLNGDTALNYSTTGLIGTGSTATSDRATSNNLARFGYIPAANATANTFSSNELYIPSYLVSQNKPLNGFGAEEDNITTAYLHADASLWRNTAAITSILVLPNSGSFVSGSSFYLYGIKNS